MIAKLVECSDYKMTYGVLTVENVEAEKVQEKIHEIKNKFFDEGFEDWTIDDVLMEFPEEWEWNFENNVDVLEI